MQGISKEVLQSIRDCFPRGTRVELVKMKDLYNSRLIPGCQGTVSFVDSIGTIHVNWDCGSSLGVIYGVDICRKIEE